MNCRSMGPVLGECLRGKLVFAIQTRFESRIGRFHAFVPVAGDQFLPVLSFYAARNPNATNSTLLSSGLLLTGGLGFSRSASVACYSACVLCPISRARLSLSSFFCCHGCFLCGPIVDSLGFRLVCRRRHLFLPSQSGVSPQRLRGPALVRGTCPRTPTARCAFVSPRRYW